MIVQHPCMTDAAAQTRIVRRQIRERNRRAVVRQPSWTERKLDGSQQLARAMFPTWFG